MSLRIRGRSRRPRQKRERRQTIPQLIMPETARAIRHGLHTIHHIEHFAERRHKHMIAEATAPLTVTISATVNMEDLEDVDDETMAEIEDDIEALLEDIASNSVELAKALAPVKTGQLRNSIDSSVDDNALEITLSADTRYARFQEYGTSKMEANPYLTPVVAKAEEELNTGIEAIIATHLDGKMESESPDIPDIDLEIEGESELFEALE